MLEQGHGHLPIDVPDPREHVERYVGSVRFVDDMQTTADLWSTAGIEGGAGLFLLVTYATLPTLTEVGADIRGDALMLRSAHRLGRERTALARLAGLTREPEWRGGLRNPLVRAMLTDLGDHHRRMSGMKQEYLDFFGGLVAVSALRMHSYFGTALPHPQLERYWTYMRSALAMLGCRLDEPSAVDRACARFTNAHSRSGRCTRTYIRDLFAAHPEHVPGCLGVLYPATLRVVAEAGQT